MIQIQKPLREDAVAQELRAIEDRKKEESIECPDNSTASYWIFLAVITVIASAILLF